MKVETRNKRIREAIQFILKEPRRFNMRYPVEPVRESSGTKVNFYGLPMQGQIDLPPCGTVCCFAGALYLQGMKIRNLKSRQFSWFYEVQPYAKERLGLSEMESRKLFHVEDWPETFEILYNNATTSIERAYVGAARFEHYIATGE